MAKRLPPGCVRKRIYTKGLGTRWWWVCKGKKRRLAPAPKGRK